MLKHCTRCGKPFGAKGRTIFCTDECRAFAKKELAAAATKRWAEKNPEKNRKKKREYYQRNKEHLLELSRKWHEKNPNRAKEKSRKGQEANRERSATAYRVKKEADRKHVKEVLDKVRERAAKINRPINF
jgi:hypothetical protein